MIKTNIKLRVTPEQSVKIQQICFDNKIYWNAGQNFVIDTGKYLFIDKDSITFSSSDKQSLYQHEFEEVDPGLFIATKGSCKTTNTFKEYGFQTPDFECELWQVETSTSFEYVHGLVLNDYAHPTGNLTYHKWNKKTGEVLVGCSSKSLTPIKKHWYETCKFPALVWDEDNDLLVIRTRGEYTALYLKACIPLTNDEIEELKQ